MSVLHMQRPFLAIFMNAYVSIFSEFYFQHIKGRVKFSHAQDFVIFIFRVVLNHLNLQVFENSHWNVRQSLFTDTVSLGKIVARYGYNK